MLVLILSLSCYAAGARAGVLFMQGGGVLQEQDTTSMRRCMSESQVVRSGSETSSGSPSPPDVFPSLPDVVLQQLGLASAVATRPR